MTSITFSTCAIIVALFALFPNETTDAVLDAEIEIRIALLNLQLFTAQWMIYRKLKKEFDGFGIEVPPFEFVPIERRGLLDDDE